MNFKVVSFIILAHTLPHIVYSQIATFKDNKWFDPKKAQDFYRYPINENSVLVISHDSIVAHLGNNTFKYLIKKVEDNAKRFEKKYTVIDNGGEGVIRLFKIEENLRGGNSRKVANVIYRDWAVAIPITNIEPAGFIFPGDKNIDIQLAKDQLPGYYEFSDILSKSSEDIIKMKRFIEDFRLKIGGCQKDMQIEFRPDNTATWWTGQKSNDCKKNEQAFKWRLGEVVLKGERTMILSLINEFDSDEFTVIDVSKGKLVLLGEFYLGLGDDSTQSGYLELKKAKKK